MNTILRLLHDRRVVRNLISAVALLVPVYAAAAPYHGVNAWYNFSNSPFAAVNMVEQRMYVRQDAPYQYYAAYFEFMFGGAGYMGLQSNGRMPATNQETHLARFSLWDANAFVETGGRCAFFSHEGSGVECAIPFWWSPGRWYVTQVIDRGADAHGRWWEGSVKDETTGTWYSIARIRTPHTSFITDVAQFTESFGQPIADDCGSIRRSEVVMIAPFGAPNGTLPAVLTDVLYPNPCTSAWSYTGYGAIAMIMGR